MLSLALVVLASAVAQPMPDLTSEVFDPVGDTFIHSAPAFQDVVRGRMTKTESGDFQLLMEMAGPVPAAPTLPPLAAREIWWVWTFGLDPTTAPRGYPFAPGSAHRPEFLVYVSWDGTEFAGTAVDRRPLLTGGAAIVTPVPFSIDGTIVQADLAFIQIGNVPASFRWTALTVDWAGPIGSDGLKIVDASSNTVFNP